jgi:tetratricopeptide (TPR) repeat protein
MGYQYTPIEKVTVWTVLLRNTIGTLWSILVFPYNIFAFFAKKPAFNEWFSGITLEAVKGRQKSSKLGIFLSIVSTLAMVSIIGFSVYLYQVGPLNFIEGYINHERLVKDYISKSGYGAAENALEKYKKYSGETSSYWYYKCLIDGHQDTDEASLATCTTAEEQNKADETKSREILVVKANLLRVNYKPQESLAIYEKLWNDYSIRTFDMVNYVYLLESLDQQAKSLEVLNELYKTLSNSRTMDTIQQMFFAELYYNVEKYDDAIALYTQLLEQTEQRGLTEQILGDIYYKLGQSYYHQNKFDLAKEAFTKAKEKNVDYTDSADAYIIEIDFRNRKR